MVLHKYLNFERKYHEVKEIGDRFIAIKLVLEKYIIHIISAYAPQVGLDESLMRQFWEIDCLI